MKNQNKYAIILLLVAIVVFSAKPVYTYAQSVYYEKMLLWIHEDADAIRAERDRYNSVIDARIEILRARYKEVEANLGLGNYRLRNE